MRKKVNLLEFQPLYDAVCDHVAEWVEKNCTSCPHACECWHLFDELGPAVFTDRLLKCPRHTPITRRYFELKANREVEVVDHPLAIRRLRG
jgi:hypothetical protein